ncbi:hypothetical protein TRIUR3_35086 [Triticum urartu]|uniref:Uncharacterized protein n=1 Tax=Triticum urartu TaxID=4572 RepID=M7YSM1_TRIUA|nr:hypothetical protein TRIUR3_35086 [Triticum urartu]
MREAVGRREEALHAVVVQLAGGARCGRPWEGGRRRRQMGRKAGEEKGGGAAG